MKKPLARTRSNRVAALDVGSSKICCFIAEKHPNGVPRVAGIGQQASKGVKNGAIVGMDQAEEAIRAEAAAGAQQDAIARAKEAQAAAEAAAGAVVERAAQRSRSRKHGGR